MKFLRIAYFVSRCSRTPHRKKITEIKHGALRIKGNWNERETHLKIRARIMQRNKGWQIGAYTPKAKIVVTVEARGYREAIAA